MAKAFRLPALDEATIAALQQQYDTTSDADLRLRTQMVLLAHHGRSVSEIAQIAFRSQDTVLRHLKGFVRGGAVSMRWLLRVSPLYPWCSPERYRRGGAF